MPNFIIQWFTDPTVQSLLLAPLIGAVMGLVLTMLVPATPPSAKSPQTVHEIKVIFVERVHSRHSSPDDGNWILPAGVVAIFFITWSYARYASMGIEWWAYFTLTFLSFNITAVFAALVKRELIGGWLAYVLLPLLAMLVSLWLASKAEAGILKNAAELANEHGIVQFYLNVLNNAQRHWLLTQGLGVLTGFAATLISAMRLTYYVALSNQRGIGWWAGLWRIIARVTQSASGAAGFYVGLFLYIVSGLLLNGVVYHWIVSPNV